MGGLFRRTATDSLGIWPVGTNDRMSRVRRAIEIPSKTGGENDVVAEGGRADYPPNTRNTVAIKWPTAIIKTVIN